MKRLLTEVQVSMGDKVFRFKGIPPSRLRPILGTLKKYQEESIPWRELAKDRINDAGGESAYMVRTARKQAGMTQEELASKLKMPQSNVSQIETGARPVGKGLAKRLSKIFNLDYRVFL